MGRQQQSLRLSLPPRDLAASTRLSGHAPKFAPMSCDIDNATSAKRTQEFRKNFSNNWQAGCGNLIWSATATDPT